MAERGFLRRRVVVGELVTARYRSNRSGDRPLSWNERSSGTEVIKTINGEELLLHSTGGQSSPVPGWELLLMSETAGGAYRWTLYGIKPESERNSRLI